MRTCPYFIVELDEEPSGWPLWLFAGGGGYVLLGPVGVAGVSAAYFYSMANGGHGV